MTALIIVRFALCWLVLAITSATDLLHRRIPNAVTLPAVAVGLILTAVCKENLLFVVAVIIGLFFVGMLGIFGSGDLKLMMAITSLCGVIPMLMCVSIASVGVLTVELFRNPRQAVQTLKEGLGLLTGRTKPDEQGRRIPFAPYLLFGFTLWLTVYSFI